MRAYEDVNPFVTEMPRLHAPDSSSYDDDADGDGLLHAAQLQ